VALLHATAVRGTYRPPQSVPLTEIAHPSRGRIHPCSYPPVCWIAPSKLLLQLLSPTPTLSRSCLDPRGHYGLPFCAPKCTSRLSWSSSDELAPYHWLHLLRRLVPSMSPFCTSSSCPKPAVAAFPSFRPSSTFSFHARILDPLKPRARTTIVFPSLDL
jgi:hypothetical protein